MSMIELAHLVLLEEKKAMNFRDIFEKVAEMKEFSEKQMEENIDQFYTDLNIDGRFMTPGSNMWGLKRWYPVDQIDEEINLAPKKKKKKAKKKAEVFEEEELDIEEEDLDIVDGDVEDIVDGFDDEDEEFDDLDDDDDFDEFDEEEDEDFDEVDDEELDDDSKEEEK
ncbi:DNA-directed RNA polymerase subunit delta [Ornithinibacillus sp. L9]|uniref:Probable DNA-directed RNA polymerase subunit delta n=2 Tax=Ornithinibacillus caprae TaxID=2678566 RepID=A0A6N8FJI8_9BACI|nr:DNA-directed RNA polymerase subunit delta [Ornithinibacillus caprae]MUK89625.1 DNA-directed RNA polymerase subunit delta [Ornithinibacillus caprae]